MKLDIGIGAEQRAEPPAGRKAADFVRQQQAPLAVAEQHGGLLDVGHRGAPGAGLAQRARELRRHRRLGVRAQRRRRRSAPAQEEVAIGGEGGLIEGEGGQAQIAARTAPSAGCRCPPRRGHRPGECPVWSSTGAGDPTGPRTASSLPLRPLTASRTIWRNDNVVISAISRHSRCKFDASR